MNNINANEFENLLDLCLFLLYNKGVVSNCLQKGRKNEKNYKHVSCSIICFSRLLVRS